jgi:hypothetical protein
MLKENERVRFINEEKDKQFGILYIFSIKGEYATIGKGDYTTLGQNMINVKLTEIKRIE